MIPANQIFSEEKLASVVPEKGKVMITPVPLDGGCLLYEFPRYHVPACLLLKAKN